MKFFIKTVIIFVFLLGVFDTARASSIFFNTTILETDINTPFKITVYFDPEDDFINTIESKIKISDNIQITDIFHGNSLIPLWINQPSFKDNEINFSGIIPGGYNGELTLNNQLVFGELLTIIGEIKTKESGSIIISDALVLANDGQGTAVPVSLDEVNIIFKEGAKNEASDIDDTIPPDSFEISVENNELFGEETVAIFSTRDGQSGIDHYEIKLDNGIWSVAESPYVLEKIPNKINVKAIDKKGNIFIAEYKITDNFVEKNVKNNKILYLIIVILMIGLIIFYAVSNRKKNIF